MAQWTASTTLKRFAEIILEETGKPVLTNSEDAADMTVAEAIDHFKERIVNDAMASENKPRVPKPKPPVEKPEGE